MPFAEIKDGYLRVEGIVPHSWSTAETFGYIWPKGTEPPPHAKRGLTPTVRTDTLTEMTPDPDDDAEEISFPEMLSEMAGEIAAEDSYVEMLVDRLRRHTGWSDFALSLVEFYESRGFLSRKQIAAAERMLGKKASTPPTTNPVYLTYLHLWGKIYRVQNIGKVTIVNVLRPPDECGESGVYEAIRPEWEPPTATPMSLDDLKGYGILYGICAFCAGALDTPDEEAEGIHPTCAEAFESLEPPTEEDTDDDEL